MVENSFITISSKYNILVQSIMECSTPERGTGVIQIQKSKMFLTLILIFSSLELHIISKWDVLFSIISKASRIINTTR
jgi:hypothetical protein